MNTRKSASLRNGGQGWLSSDAQEQRSKTRILHEKRHKVEGKIRIRLMRLDHELREVLEQPWLIHDMIWDVLAEEKTRGRAASSSL